MRLDFDRLPSCAKTQLAPAGAQFLKGENRLAGTAGIGHKGLFPVSRETVTFHLQANHTLQRAELGLARLQAQFVAFVAKHRACRACVKLGVLIVDRTPLPFDGLKWPREATHLALQGIAVLLHADGDRVFGHRAVICLEGFYRCPEVTPVKVGRATDSATLRLAGRIAQTPSGNWRTGPPHITSQVLGYAYIMGLAVKCVYMQAELVGTCLHQGAGCTLAISTTCAQFPSTRDPPFAIEAGFGLNSAVDHIHHAPHSASTILQRTRATQYFDALNRQGVNGHSMVKTQARGVGTGAAIVQDPDAVTVQAAHGGAAGHGTKVGAADAR